MPITYTVDSLDNRTSRIDAHYFDPRYYATMEKLKSVSKKLGLKITPLGLLLDTSSKTCLTGGATPLGAVYVSEGVKFIRVQNVQPNKLELKDIVFINYATHETLLKRSQLKPNDILLTITGTYGITCVVPPDIGDANINQHCVKMEVDQTKIDPYYLSCFLNSDLGKRQMDRAVTGSSRPALDYSSIRALLIAHPKDIKEQSEVVQPIQELENEAFSKITRANKLIENERDILLELLKIKLPPKPAKGTFEVEPNNLSDRLDAIYHDPGYNALIGCLKQGAFPCEPLYKLAKVDTKRIDPKEFPDTLYEYIDLDDIDGELGAITSREVFGVEVRGTKTSFESGHILLSRLRYYLRKIALVPQGFGNGLGSPEFHTITCFEDIEPFFLTSVLRHEVVVKQTEHKATGSSRPRLTKTDIENLWIPRPPYDAQQNIAIKMGELYSQITKLRNEAKTLLTVARQKLEEHLLT